MSASEVKGEMALFPDLSAETAERNRLEGMLPSQEIRELIAKGSILAPSSTITEKQIQPASLDLRLGDVAYRVQASFVPQNSTVEHGIRELGLKITNVDLTRATVFEKGCVYIVPLLEELNLPDDISAWANPKSSTGRLDIFTRLITDYGIAFEKVRPGYKGRLFAEIASRTFTIAVRAGITLNQLRFIRGKPKPSERATKALERAEWEKDEALVYDEEGNPEKALIDKQSVKLSVNLRGNDPSEVIAYKARENTPVIDLTNINHYDPNEFWDVRHDPGKRGLILDPGGFYILASKERLSVPPEWAAEMVSMDQDIGEFRIHYAGFFDPGFGYGSNDVKGTRAVLEVRAHEVPFLIEHGQIMGRLKYFPLVARPDKIYGVQIGSSYQRQGLALSKHFKKS
ncbi:MAG TPA: 2'-deoxycytidine 5'-triphosphate deaminase [Candidatus Angelobacter sp.]|jgi:dCTP deaminase|nr:2'-deoxycytidine 5'-triphosphate deaminase [Candidatus Angelobacter sp.]